MSTPFSQSSIYSTEQVYGPIGLSDEEFDAILDESLQPRGADMLYALMDRMGLGADHTVLDIGCRDLRHGLKLVELYGCRVVGVDPLDYHLDMAREQIRNAGMRGQAQVKSGLIEKIPATNEAFDFIWCRDMLNHVSNLTAAFTECRRVLKPGGRMLIYHTSATELLEAAEAAQLYPPLGINEATMDQTNIEKAFINTGFKLEEEDTVGSEWREHWEEDGTAITSRQLLRLSRMLRNREGYISRVGLAPYETELANCKWGVYQMLGKLSPTVYIIRKAE